MPHEHTATVNLNQVDDGFDVFAKELSLRAKSKVLNWVLEKQQEVQVPAPLVRVNCSIFDAYLNGFSDEMRQQYNCRTCKGFLDGIGSFGYITPDYKLESLVFDEDDSWVPERFKLAYQNIVGVFKNQNTSTHLVCIDEVHELGNFLGTTELHGGFNHFGIDAELRSNIHSTLAGVALNPARAGHGYGQAELKVIHDWLQLVADSGVLKIPLPADQFREKDQFVYRQIMDRAQEYQVYNKSLYVKYIVATLGLELLYLKNSVIGQLIQDIAKGLPFHEAYDRYLSYIDPRYYKRPVRLPTEQQFESSVQFLTEKGYDKLLPQRFATFEEIESQLTWVKKPEQPKEKGMFDTLRNQVVKESTPTEKHRVRLEPISTNGLVDFIAELEGDIVSIKHHFNRHTVGSYTAGIDEGSGAIYKDGRRVQPWSAAEPISKQAAANFYQFTSESVDGFIVFDWDDRYRGIVTVTKGVWRSPLQTILSEDQVIAELQPHMRTIMHWASTAKINTNDDGGVIQFDNTPITVLLDIGQTVEIETSNAIYPFEITARR